MQQLIHRTANKLSNKLLTQRMRYSSYFCINKNTKIKRTDSRIELNIAVKIRTFSSTSYAWFSRICVTRVICRAHLGFRNCNELKIRVYFWATQFIRIVVIVANWGVRCYDKPDNKILYPYSIEISELWLCWDSL